MPPPPDGCRRVGPAYLIAGPALEASLPAGVAILPAYDRINDPENLMYLPARLSRLDGDNAAGRPYRTAEPLSGSS
ncbi:MAG: hypothetical protein IPH86_15025 [bacterium]|nr:hypothetical protein [bacterium]